MTGELFDLLSRRSILANSVDAEARPTADEIDPAFLAGVEAGANGNLLNAIFGVRVADLHGRRSRGAAYHYLSGLLIGAELRDLRSDAARPIVLVGEAGLADRYARALAALGHAGPVSTISAGDAVLAGHRLIAERLGWFG
jgi:2-dehydro-3-deoxygalactonokinase